MANLIPLEHPGIIVKEEFLEPLELSAYRVAKEANINESALGLILKGKRNISPKTGLKLARYFGMSDNFFMNIQLRYDLDKTKQAEKKSLGKIIPFAPKGKKSLGDEELLEA